MAKPLFILIALAPPMATVSAEPARSLKFDPQGAAKSLPAKPPKMDRSCAAYGAGFVRVEGTDTCVKVGGSVGVGVGGSLGR